jgi:membrane protease subunit HflK
MIKKFKNMLAAQEGPPDLDELFKDLKGKLNSFLGGKTRQGPRGVPNEPNNTSGSDSIPVGPIILIVALIWMATGFYIVDQGSRGIILRFGKKYRNHSTGPKMAYTLPN